MEKKLVESIDDVIWDPERPCVTTSLEEILKKRVYYSLFAGNVAKQMYEWVTEKTAYHKELSNKILLIHKVMVENHVENESVKRLYQHHHDIGARYSLAVFHMEFVIRCR
jgi:hypothetical protein